jgi:hypothetical protein
MRKLFLVIALSLVALPVKASTLSKAAIDQYVGKFCASTNHKYYSIKDINECSIDNFFEIRKDSYVVFEVWCHFLTTKFKDDKDEYNHTTLIGRARCKGPSENDTWIEKFKFETMRGGLYFERN